MIELSTEQITEAADTYADTEPLVDVEEEHIRMLPKTLKDQDIGKRDVEWVVQWYYRRHLGQYPGQQRQKAEEAFRQNDFNDVLIALDETTQQTSVVDKMQLLTDLSGVDVPVASAFLQFLDPDAYLVTGPRTWAVLHAAGELSKGYPNSPSVIEYNQYLKRGQAIASQCECDCWTVYKALWQIWKQEIQS